MANLIKKILIAPNSYKESMDSVRAASLLENFLASEELETIAIPLSDGGDGFLEASRTANPGGEILWFEVFPDKKSSLRGFNSFKVPVYYLREHGKLFIESADVIGLKLIPTEKRDPVRHSSFALGDLLLRIKQKIESEHLQIRDIIIGVGGTSIMDMGMGALVTFGLKLLDDAKEELEVIPANFIITKEVKLPDIEFPYRLTVISDVTNPLLGEEGGIQVYSSQKGASDKDIELTVKGIENLLSLFSAAGVDFKKDTLSGAGGGIIAGLSLFLNTRIKTSEQFILQDLGVEKYKGNVDYVITGEGKFDNQSFYSKAAGIILNSFKDIPVFLCCGIIEDYDLPDNIIPIEFSRFFESVEESKQQVHSALEQAAAIILQFIDNNQ